MNPLVAIFMGNSSSKQRALALSTSSENEAFTYHIRDMIGKIGHTLTQLKLCGYIEVDGVRFEAMSNIALDKFVPVVITGYCFGLFRVEPIEGSIAAA